MAYRTPLKNHRGFQLSFVKESTNRPFGRTLKYAWIPLLACLVTCWKCFWPSRCLPSQLDCPPRTAQTINDCLLGREHKALRFCTPTDRHDTAVMNAPSSLARTVVTAVIGRSTEWLIYWLTDRPIDWLTDRSIDWLTDRLIPRGAVIQYSWMSSYTSAFGVGFPFRGQPLCHLSLTTRAVGHNSYSTFQLFKPKTKRGRSAIWNWELLLLRLRASSFKPHAR